MATDDHIFSAMSLHTQFYRAVTAPNLRLATAIGLISAPVTAVLSWGTVLDDRAVIGGTVSGGAFLVVGLLVGYLYYHRPPNRRSAGIRAGVTASLGLVVVYLAKMFSMIDASSHRATAVAVVGTLLAVVVGVGMSILVVCVAAVIGDRFAAVRSWQSEVKDTAPQNRKEVDGRKWWRYVAGYTLLVPVTAGYLFGIAPISPGGGLLGAVLLFVTVIAAAVALVAVYKDAERLYANGSSWIPNVIAYVGVPVVAFVIGYYVAAFNAWEAPAAVGQYSFLSVCWLAAIVYLVDRRRSVGAV